MKIVVLKNNFKDGVDGLGRLASEGLSPLPVLKNFLLKTVDGKICLYATNLELAITRIVPGKIIEDGGLAVPLGVMGGLIGSLSSEKVELRAENNFLTLKTDNYEAKIQGIKEEEFPLIPKIKTPEARVTFAAGNLLEALGFVLSAVQANALKPELRGVLFDFKNGVLSIVGTDSFRLAEKTAYAPEFEGEEPPFGRVLAPARAIQEVIRVFKGSSGKIVMEFDESQILFRDETTEVISHRLSGEFPDYQAIIPKTTTAEFAVSRPEFIQALKLTGALADRFNEIRVIIKEKAKAVEVASVSPLGENRYMLPAKIKGEPLEAVFNWRFFLDGLKDLLSQTIVVRLSGDARPAAISGEEDASYLYLVMPIKSG